MESIGKTVVHGLFGKGRITRMDDTHVKVEFENKSVGEKLFVFPDAFARYITFEDEMLQSEAEKLFDERKRLADEAALTAEWEIAAAAEAKKKKAVAAAARRRATKKNT